MLQKLFLSIIIGLGFYSCNTIELREQQHFFPSHEWSSKDSLQFKFDIQDTTVPYRIYLVVRHEDAYSYNNIWVNIGTKRPAETMQYQLLDIKLADPVKGWLGSGMDDIYDHRISLTPKPIRLRKGQYVFHLKQAMREDPLQYVLNAGIRVEKVTE